MGWPTPQDYNEAVQNPKHCFADEQLEQGSVRLNELGLPRSMSGSFASVYEITVDEERFAVRCFLHDIPDQEQRYQRLSDAILHDRLPQTVDFQFQPDGIKIGDEYFPIVKMPWVEGPNLDAFIKQNLDDIEAVKRMHAEFTNVLRALESEGFAHGDLQHGNIIISKDGLRLVDYDGMFVPALTGLCSNELGHRNFQHPSRSRDHFGSYLDNFSAWVIHVSLICVEEDAALFEKLHCDEGLLFRQEDFINPTESNTFFQLEKHASARLRDASRRLRTALSCEPYNVPGLFDSVPLADEHPKVVQYNRAVAQTHEWISSSAHLADGPALSRTDLRTAGETGVQTQSTPQTPAWLDQATATALSQPEARVKASEAESASNAASNAPAVASATAPSPSTVPSALPPSVNDYLTAMREDFANTDISLREYVLNIKGDPQVVSGDHIVFRLSSAQDNIALKMFADRTAVHEQRLALVQKVISSLPKSLRMHFRKTRYIPGAVRVSGNWHPATVSPWLDSAAPLNHILRTTKTDFDYTLLHRFRHLISLLQRCGIAHGSLEASNLLVMENEFVLVDYDNLYSSELADAGYVGTGTTRCPHPRAREEDFGAFIDHFPAWVLDATILCWCADKSLWNHFADATGYLFRADDFSQPSGSRILPSLLQHQQYELAERARFLLRCLKHEPAEVPPLTADGTIPEGWG